MVRYLREGDVQKLLTMPLALDLVQQALKAHAEHRALDVPRARIHLPTGTQHVLQAAAPELKLIGFKYYYTRPTGKSFYVHLMNTESARLEGIIEAIWMSMVRTGAASGVATRHLARQDASTVGQIGAGFQAIGQLEAVCQVRKIRRARVFARNRERLEAFCKTMSQRFGIEVSPAASAQAAVQGADIVNVITKSATPVLAGEWLEPGQHINAAGSNALTRRELDALAIEKSDVIAVDARATARGECGDLLPAIEKGLLHWDALVEIGEIIAGRAAGRTSARQVSLYESHGMGLQDLYVGARMLALARERGIGIELPIGGAAALKQ